MFKMKGFTLIELILILAILAIVSVLSIPFIQSFQTTSDLYTYTDSLNQTLRQAQRQAIAGKNNSAWGVYFDTGSNQFVLFKGDNYTSRDPEYDQVTDYPAAFAVSTDFGDEIYFSIYSGNPSTVGSTTIFSVNTDDSKNIIITSSGVIQLND